MATAYGLDIQDLPDDWTPLELVAVIRCLDGDGRETAAMRNTDGLQSWEIVGLLHTAEHQTLSAEQWEDEDEDDDG